MFWRMRAMTYKPKKREKRFRRKIKISKKTTLFIQPFKQEDSE
jgi:hypothetical protein